MAAVQYIVYMVNFWSLLHTAVVNGQCTEIGCGAGYHGNDMRNHLDTPITDRYSEFRSDLDELNLRIQLITDELGKLHRLVVYTVQVLF